MSKRRRVWRQVMGLAGARVVEKDARAEVVCRCGRLVVLGEWDAVERCGGCGRWYSLVCVVKESEGGRGMDDVDRSDSAWNDYWGGGNGDE